MQVANEQELAQGFRFKRTKPRIRPLDSRRTDGGDWLRETPQRRIDAVEFLRASMVGPAYASQRITRILGITRQA